MKTTAGKCVSIADAERVNDFLRHAHAEFNVAHGFLGVHGLHQWIDSNVSEIYLTVTNEGRLIGCNDASELIEWSK